MCVEGVGEWDMEEKNEIAKQRDAERERVREKELQLFTLSFLRWKKAVSGLVSGAVGAAIANPTDLVKVRETDRQTGKEAERDSRERMRQTEKRRIERQTNRDLKAQGHRHFEREEENNVDKSSLLRYVCKHTVRQQARAIRTPLSPLQRSSKKRD